MEDNKDRAERIKNNPNVTTIELCKLGKGEWITYDCFVCCTKTKHTMLWQDDHVERFLCDQCGYGVAFSKKK